MGIFQKRTLGIVYDEWNYDTQLLKSGLFFATTWRTSDHRYIHVVLPSEMDEQTMKMMMTTGQRIFEIDYTVVTLSQIACFIKILPKCDDKNKQSFLLIE